MVYSLRTHTRRPNRFADTLLEEELQKEEQRELEEEEEEAEESITETKRPKLIERRENSRARVERESQR
ncbi:hypothetical protein Scep_023012 [Stephania cephalantha]|uniref:Uncharacterized protein n=1 Tax=Stephania cephalantha TaxID=152367 RepID=A0AAP0HYB5_9MAGN